MLNTNEKAQMHEKIQRRAYQIYLEHSFHPGNALDDWLAAEKELTEPPESRAADESPGALRRFATA